MPQHLIQQELEAIKSAGFNFLRLGHYPQDDFVLDLCDRLGLIVWEELPWCRGGVGGDIFKDTARAMLVEMIEQHHNHPSIIFWGLGNELDWESEHPGSSDEIVADFLNENGYCSKAPIATMIGPDTVQQCHSILYSKNWKRLKAPGLTSFV